MHVGNICKERSSMTYALQILVHGNTFGEKSKLTINRNLTSTLPVFEASSVLYFIWTVIYSCKHTEEIVSYNCFGPRFETVSEPLGLSQAEGNLHLVGFDVFMAVSPKTAVFWVFSSCSSLPKFRNSVACAKVDRNINGILTPYFFKINLSIDLSNYLFPPSLPA